MNLLTLSICDVTTAHCEACRDERRGPVLWVQWEKVFKFDAEPDGRPACVKRRAMGWKRGSLPPSPMRRPRRVPLDVVVPPEVAAARLAICAVCDSNVDGACVKQKASCGGSKPAAVAAGVWMPRAHCPDDPSRWNCWPGPPAAVGCAP